ncbi:type 1 glutamine amidotransferase family protein [Propionibacterium australiense]|uniref:Class I glutamine amidotransferase-like n=1 Tax=Propionibacterium australiense TaxID=119981 RepID=A0A383S737_9ACTN|nr:hypothetical protein [Propionibacterium australiense]SYZ33066.1 Class I glutamine amidotransferase-like [Propionibacterium australiense]VEH89052.1 cyanophycinase [Propionibacterium australiense]
MSILLSGAGAHQLPEPVVARFAGAAATRSGHVGVVVDGAQGQELLDELTARLGVAGQVEVEAFRLVPGEPLALPDDPGRLSGIVITDVDGAALLSSLGEQRRPLARAIRGGLVYLGLGAGARLVAKHAIVSGSLAGGRRVADEASGDGELVVADGLAVIGTTVETSTDTRHRLERAITAVITSPASYAVALDEGVTLLVDPVSGAFDALGDGIVQWVHSDGGDVRIRRTRAVAFPATNQDTPAAGETTPSPNPAGVNPSSSAIGEAT